MYRRTFKSLQRPVTCLLGSTDPDSPFNSFFTLSSNTGLDVGQKESHHGEVVED